MTLAALTADLGIETDPGLFEVIEVCQGLSLDREELFCLMPESFADSGIEYDAESDMDSTGELEVEDDINVNGGISSIDSCCTWFPDMKPALGGLSSDADFADRSGRSASRSSSDAASLKRTF